MKPKPPTDLTDHRTVRKHFKREIRALENRHQPEQRNGKRFDCFTPSLLRLIYAFGKELHLNNSTDRLIKNSKVMDSNADCKVDTDNIFAVIIEGYIRECFEEKQLSSGQRSKYSRALDYAHQHKITVNWLGAFLKEVGGYEIAAKKYRVGQKENWVKRRATF